MTPRQEDPGILSHRIRFQPLRPADNAAMAKIIRTSLAEFGLAKAGTVYTDPTTDDLYRLFLTPRSYYMTAWDNVQLLGGAGIFPSPGLPPDICELVKMYLIPSARSKGLGWTMIQACLQQARQHGYRQVYIETMPALKRAIAVYQRFGFRHLEGPMGNTGHFGCEVWMILDL
ncbi:MAG: GNAT family N-acetyltransferase [Bacteroidetes bacterium]|nr:GNAT family N-acetyltransferase [Bacteroidota bacterium]